VVNTAASTWLRPGPLRVLVGIAATVLALSGCGGGDENGAADQAGDGGGGTVTVYSSLPLQGAARPQSEKLVNGIKLALKQAGGKAGNFTVKYVSLDDATPQAGSWTPEATSANARKVTQDDSAIAYIGEFNSGATAISLPILNEAGIPQVSPANSAVGLTTDGPGAEPGEPDKYYPTGTRTFARIVPTDLVQGAGMVQRMNDQGCSSAFVVNDKEVYGAGLADNIIRAADRVGLEIAGDEAIDPRAANYRSLAGKMRSSGADCFAYAGITANNAVQLFKDIAAANPDAKVLMGSDAVAEPAFTDPDEGGLPADVAKRVTVTAVGLAPRDYPPAGQKFFDDYRAAYGAGDPGQYAIFGFEAMSLILDAIERAGDQGNDRAAVLEQIMSTEDRESVIGTYSITETGDTTLTNYGVYGIADGSLKYVEAVEAPSIQ
jgi:branched-chain amino acid transport system substrate-binding protein